MAAVAVLVTGAAGFLGSRVVEMLSAAGRFDVVATDVVRTARAEAHAALPGVRFETVDLRDAGVVDGLVAASDVVVHLAAVRTAASAGDPRSAFDVNVGASYDLVAQAVRHGVRRFVFGSSHLVYGRFDDPHARPYREEQAAVRPGLSMYASCKLAVEAFLSAFAASDGLDHLSLRFGTIYGPRVNADSNAGILLRMLDAIDEGRAPEIPWTRDSVHGLTYVDDAAAAVLRAIESEWSGGPVNVVGEPVTAETMYTTLAELAGGDPAELVWRDERARYQWVDSGCLRTELGLESWTPMKQGLTELIRWHRDRSR